MAANWRPNHSWSAAFLCSGRRDNPEFARYYGKCDYADPQNLASLINVTHNNDFKQGLYFGKLTLFGSDTETFDASAYIRRENNLSDIDGNATPSHGRTIKTRQDRFQFSWRHTGDEFFNTFNIAFDKGSQSTPSVGTGPEFRLSSGVNFDTIAQTGAHFFEQGDVSEIWTIKDDMIWRKGDHTIKAGGQIAFMNLSRTVNENFNGTYFYVNPGAVASFDPLTATPMVHASIWRPARH